MSASAPEDVDEVPTVAGGSAAPSRAGDSTGELASGGGTTRSGVSRTSVASTSRSVLSPRDALRLEEVERLRVFSVLMMGLCTFGLGLVPFLGAERVARDVFLGALAVIFATYAVARYLTRSPETFDDLRLAVLAHVQAVASVGVAYYFGVLSPFAGVVAIVVFMYCLGAPTRYASSVYLNVAIGHGGLGAAVTWGLVPELGLVRGDGLGLVQRLLVLLCVQVVYLLAFSLGRASREKAQKAISELEAAVREVAQREALLAEARQELDRAAGLGEPGRFTEQVLGDYRLGVVIGRGAMGEIYAATHVESGEEAAVKLLHRSVLGDAAHVARFVREARIAASLSVPNVVRVLDVGGPEAPLPFIAMERLRGKDLSAVLRETRRLAPDALRQMVREVATGLEAARLQGVVHRDLKPQNLFRAELGGGHRAWKVLDFGVSKLVDDGGTLTQGHLVGTPAYMAPEQAEGDDVDHRADVYALAVIAYRSLTGQPPFTGGRDIPALLRAIAEKMPARPSRLIELPEDVGDALDVVLAVGLAKFPGQRFDTALELADALEAALDGQVSDALRDRADGVLGPRPWRGEAGRRITLRPTRP